MNKGRLLLYAVLTAFALTGCTRTEPGQETAALPEPVVTEEGAEPSAGSTAEAWEEVTLTVPGAEGEISLQAAAVELSYFDGCPLVRSNDAPADMVRNFAGLLHGTGRRLTGRRHCSSFRYARFSGSSPASDPFSA